MGRSLDAELGAPTSRQENNPRSLNPFFIYIKKQFKDNIQLFFRFSNADSENGQKKCPFSERGMILPLFSWKTAPRP